LKTVMSPAMPRRLGHLGGWSAGDVVGHQEKRGGDAVRGQPLGGPGEVHDVTGVVPGDEEHPRSTACGARHGRGFGRRRRGEEVSDHRTVGEAWPHHAAEGVVVARTAADHNGDSAGTGHGRPHHAVGDTDDMPHGGVREAGEHFFGEPARVLLLPETAFR